MESQKNPYSVPFLISIGITAIIFVILIYVSAFSPDAVNNANGVPETGWSSLILTLLLMPVLIIFSLVSLFLGLAYKKRKRIGLPSKDPQVNNEPVDNSYEQEN